MRSPFLTIVFTMNLAGSYSRDYAF
uniref:Uncharacterized protein n=1 Tax=Anguilla anguilla TaxID=7936 RepID=A0A0E9R3Z9_ANGAN